MKPIFKGGPMALAVLMAGSAVCAAPVITSVNPNNPLNTAGGQAITVTGTGLDAPATQVWGQISAGTHHGCASTFGGQAYCWGNDGGILGNGTGAASAIPVPVSTAGTPLAGKVIQQIMAGDNHSCALTTDGQMACWGWNEFGQLGDGTNTDRNTPVAVNTAGTPLAGKTIRQIMVAGYYTCAVSTDGQAACWGWNQHGQLGDGTTINRNIPVAISTAGTPLAGKAIRQISGGGYTCAITTDGQAACWGENSYGRLGNGTTIDSNTAVAVSTAGTPLAGKTIQQITTGNDHTCAITTGGQAACWGHNENGELGDGTTIDRYTPVAVSTAGTPLAGKTIQQITAGHYHVCALTTDGQAACWGWNGAGQLGDGTATERTAAVPVSTAGTPLAGKTIQQVSAGFEYTCATATDGQAACWGENGNGKLGDGTTTNRNTPVAVFPVSAAVPLVLAGGVAAANVAVSGGARLTFDAPPHAAGTYDLVLNYGGGVSATLPNALTYGGATVYTVTANASAGGAISPASAQVAAGQTQAFTLVPDAGYQTATVTGCGGAWAGGNTYTTGPVTADCTVAATFSRQVAQSYTVTANAIPNGTGSISPAGAVAVSPGATQAFTITPAANRSLYYVTGTCGGIYRGSTYTTRAVNADCTVTAVFR